MVVHKRGKKVTLELSDSESGSDDNSSVDTAVVHSFKRIRKSTAQKLKETAHSSTVASEPLLLRSPGIDHPPEKVNDESGSCGIEIEGTAAAADSEQAEEDIGTAGASVSVVADEGEDGDWQFDPDKESDVEVDRDWYMQDEVPAHAYLDAIDEQRVQTPKVAHVASDSQVRIAVHRLTPPFLDSKTVLSNRTDTVEVIRDRAGDLYRYSKNGSALVNERRRQRERKRNAKESVDVQNSAIGKVVEKKAEQKPVSSIERQRQLSRRQPQPKPSAEKILEQRRSLPAYKVREKFLQAVSDNQVVIVIGETGSGKTTQLPQFLYGDGYGQRGLIGITQPRRVAAVSVSKRVSEEMGVRLGRDVGYSIRFEDHTTGDTKIKFMTDGILLRETLVDPDLDQYSCIIMDEAHERSLNTDILLGLFKRLLSRRRDLKLIVTSATMNADKFSKFFGNAECFHIPGRTFPVDLKYAKVPSHDYVEDAIKQALRIHLGESEGDILIFMTGQEDIEATCEGIEDELEALEKLDKTSSIKPLSILPIYSTLPADLQQRIFEKSEYRKCIVATNIAETSLTVDGVKYVVDTGLMKLKVYNPKLGMDALQTTPISLAQANQRSGRAGRTGPGGSYRLYTFNSAKREMFAEPIPEIQRTNLDNTILLLKSLKVADIAKFPFLDRPSTEAINTAQYELWADGALTDYGKLTPLGEQMSKFPIQPMLSKLLILSESFSCQKEILSIVAMLSIPPIFVRPNNDAGLQRKSDQAREKFQIAESDHLTLLNVYEQFIHHGSSERWCQQNFLHYRSLRRAKDVRDQLSRILKKKGHQISSCEDEYDCVRECLCAAFYPNAAEFKKHGEYQHLRSGLQMALHPTSALYGGEMPEYVIYHEVLLTGRKQHMNYVTEVSAGWLSSWGSIFYSVRQRGVSARQHQEQMVKEYEERLRQ